MLVERRIRRRWEDHSSYLACQPPPYPPTILNYLYCAYGVLERRFGFTYRVKHDLIFSPHRSVSQDTLFTWRGKNNSVICRKMSTLISPMQEFAVQASATKSPPPPQQKNQGKEKGGQRHARKSRLAFSPESYIVGILLMTGRSSCRRRTLHCPIYLSRLISCASRAG